ncbi:MAG: flotillin family protein [Deltaproteobacteria bacterium]|nr:MAG: flotillin family protein [Deltaproteobacteria bacterium]
MLFTGIISVAVLALAAAAGVLIIKSLIHICQPNEVLVFSGSTHRVDGKTVGYRMVQGGRGLRIPLLEKVDRLDLTNMIIDVRVSGAYSKGGIPLNVNAVANVKISSSEPTIGNAIERFLGKPQHLVEQVAKETLEGNLRGVLATLTPEEVNQDRVKFAQSLLHEADHDLKKLGLTLDTLKIQHVSDDKGYLDSIGRKQTAELQTRSRIAEAENQALSLERDAANYETRTLAHVEAKMAIARADAERRIVDARTKKAALVAEQRAAVTALVARATGQLEVQEARKEQVRLQLEADRIRAAEARRDQMVAEARGAAAQIIEDGRATGHSLRAVNNSWQMAGDDARRIFVAQKLGTMVGQMLDTAVHAPIDEITVIDGSLSNGGQGSLAARAALASKELEQGLGVDIPGLLGGLASSLGTKALPDMTDFAQES